MHADPSLTLLKEKAVSKAIDTLTALSPDALAPSTAERRAFVRGFAAGALLAAVCCGALMESLLAVLVHFQGGF